MAAIEAAPEASEAGARKDGGPQKHLCTAEYIYLRGVFGVHSCGGGAYKSLQEHTPYTHVNTCTKSTHISQKNL